MAAPESSELNKKVFIYNYSFPIEKREELGLIVEELGGTSLPKAVEYVSEATHLIVDEDCSVVCLKALGFLLSGKHLVTPEYLVQSQLADEWETEADFRPKGMLEEVSKKMQEGNQALKDMTCAIMIRDQGKQVEFQRILQDAGASVRNWTMEELAKKGPKEIQKMNKIFTEPYFVENDEHFKKFMAKRSEKAWSVGVLSYFYLFKYSLTFPGTEERECLEKVFDVVVNKEMVEKIHKEKRERQAAKEKAILEADAADKEAEEKTNDIVSEPNSTTA